MSDKRTLDYLNAVNEALRDPKHKIITVTQCMECGDTLGVNLNSAEHWVLWDSARLEEVVVIGCEGYWQIEPASVGLENDMWSGSPGLNVA